MAFQIYRILHQVALLCPNISYYPGENPVDVLIDELYS